MNDIKAPDGLVFEYRQTFCGAGVHYLWALTGEKGAIHIWAQPDTYEHRRSDWSGGIECHYASAPDYMSADCPSHERCWLLDRPCWHDGSSLYFSEYIADDMPRNSEAVDDRTHASMLGTLRRWYREKIEGGS